MAASVVPPYDYGKILSGTEIFLNELEECIRKNLSLRGSKSVLHLTLKNARDGGADAQERVYTL